MTRPDQVFSLAHVRLDQARASAGSIRKRLDKYKRRTQTRS